MDYNLVISIMPRYTKQLTKTDCAPTGFANLLKWSGQRYSYRANRFHLYYIFNYDETGVDREDTLRVMKTPIKNLHIRIKSNVTYKEITDHLSSGGVILLGYLKDSGTGHIALVIKENENTISIVNHFINRKHKVIYKMPKKIFKKYIQKENLAFFATKIIKP